MFLKGHTTQNSSVILIEILIYIFFYSPRYALHRVFPPQYEFSFGPAVMSHGFLSGGKWAPGGRGHVSADRTVNTACAATHVSPLQVPYVPGSAREHEKWRVRRSRKQFFYFFISF